MPKKLIHVVQPVRPDSAGGAPPVFHRIGIVGLDASGRAIGLAIRRTWPSTLVIGVDGHDALERAMRWHAVDVGGDDLTMLKEADLIVLTGSVEQSVEVLTALPEYVPGAAIVTATCGDTHAVIEAAGALPPRMSFAGGLRGASEDSSDRPTAADETSRVAREPWRVVTGPGDTPDPIAAERLRQFVAGLNGGV